MQVSVVICTYNPQILVLTKVLSSLKEQTLNLKEWELLIVDNASQRPISEYVDLSWHPFAKIIHEPKSGLYHARVTGMNKSQTTLIIFVDDDNVLEPAYLEKAYNFYKAHPEVGCFGGKSIPIFETEPPAWFKETGINLGCQDYGDELHISDYRSTNFKVTSYPEKAPIGTGMVIKKKAFLQYLEDAATSPERMKLGRKGTSLSSGEDNDIILTVIKKGFEIAYVPDLVVHHLIPDIRYSTAYLTRMAFESNRSWMKVLAVHGINPHKKISKFLYGPRKLRSYYAHRAWRSPLASIQWQSSCGIFKGLSEL